MPRFRIRMLCIAAALGSGACAPIVPDAEPRGDAQRIVSLDYCADQFVLTFAERSRVLALSPDATAPFSYLREAAAGIPRVRSMAEDVLVLEPDLIVRSYGGGPNAAAYFERLGVPVVQIGYAEDIAGVQRNLRSVAVALGVPDRGDAVVADMDRRLARLAHDESLATALYLTPAGVTTGPATLMGRMIETAGLRNYLTHGGWQPVPLEELAYRQPELVAIAFFGARAGHADTWSPGRHPLLQRQTAQLPKVALEDAWTVCGGWFLLDAIEALAGWRDPP